MTEIAENVQLVEPPQPRRGRIPKYTLEEARRAANERRLKRYYETHPKKEVEKKKCQFMMDGVPVCSRNAMQTYCGQHARTMRNRADRQLREMELRQKT
jgi:hypothetical protein